MPQEAAFSTNRGEREYRVAVLMSAYGCSPFLREQLASIRAQVTADDLLVVVDDGSRCVDWDTMQDWPYPFLCWSRLASTGSSASFMNLLLDLSVRASYYCWVDQDDVWLPGQLLCQIKTLDSQSSAIACVHGWRPLSRRRDGAWAPSVAQSPVVQRSAAHYCFETPAPGMTLCMTREARRLLEAVDGETRANLIKDMPHDRLACAVIGFHGGLLALQEAFVEYRQHEANQIGAPRSSAWKRGMRRLRRGLRSWQTLRAGRRLYLSLATGAPAQGRPLPPLWRQTLRSTAWENRIFQLLARIR
jgi:hypothetical protein